MIAPPGNRNTHRDSRSVHLQQRVNECRVGALGQHLEPEQGAEWDRYAVENGTRAPGRATISGDLRIPPAESRRPVISVGVRDGCQAVRYQRIV